MGMNLLYPGIGHGFLDMALQKRQQKRTDSSSYDKNLKSISWCQYTSAQPLWEAVQHFFLIVKLRAIIWSKIPFDEYTTNNWKQAFKQKLVH